MSDTCCRCERQEVLDTCARVARHANAIRKTVIEMLHRIGAASKGHPGGAFSMADIVASLYFEVMRIDPKNPRWPDRDRFVLSKGHACPSLYAALALRGFFDIEHLYTYRHVDSILQGHPCMRKTPGVDMTMGSLGNGPGAAVGMALAARLDKRSYRTFVMVGDGELQEGVVWEAAMTAGHYRLDNLVLIADLNGWQSCGFVKSILDLEPLALKFQAFNWHTTEVDGHALPAVIDALRARPAGRPHAILAHTTKGKGVSFMEDNNAWHQKNPDHREYEVAMAELESALEAITPTEEQAVR